VKQIVILSGKGGTGKTSVAAALAHLAHAGSNPLRAVLVDADVDAANMELVLAPQQLEESTFTGKSIAAIDESLCRRCGRCAEVCRFDSVVSYADMEGAERGEGQTMAYAIDPMACEGCAACLYQCPTQAIRMEPQVAGVWFRSQSRYGPLFHAALRPAQDNSGKLVALVKQQAHQLAMAEGYTLLLVDGPPGIGCPVISATSGADLALIVAEPTAAGIHDMARALQTAAHFRVPALVCINKADVYPAGSTQIEAYCHQHSIDIVGRIPFDDSVTQAMLQGEAVTAYLPAAPASRALIDLWRRLMTYLHDEREAL